MSHDAENSRRASILSLRVDDRDNVAIVVVACGLPAGARLEDGTVLRQHVPQGHKAALADMAEGDSIIRYGEVIGRAAGAIPRGSWIDESLVALPQPPALETCRSPPVDHRTCRPWRDTSSTAIRNADGTVGSKNMLGITTSVQCVAGVADYLVRRIKAELLPRYPHVDDVVALNHTYGCGVAINAPGAVVPIRTLQNLALNPNLGGEVMIVGLGCEKLEPQRLVPAGMPRGGEGADAAVLQLQDEAFHGFGAMVDAMLEMAERRLARLNRRRREPCPASGLVVGLQCGGSDAFSGITANPALGFAADLIVRAGGTVMFSEVTEVRDAIHLLTPRAADAAVGRALLREMDWYDRYLDAGGADRSANPTPGQQGRRTGQYRGEGARLDRQVREQPDRRCPRPRGARAAQGTGLRRHPGQRLRLRDAAAGRGDEPAGVYHRARHPLRPGAGAGDQGRHPHRARRTLARSDRPRRRPHRHRRGEHRRGRLGAVSTHSGGGERAQQAAADRLGLHNDLVLFNPAPVT